MKIKTINDKILVKLTDTKEKTNKNILIPETDKDKSNKGEIISISEDINFYKSNLKIGDIIIFNKFSGQNIKIKNENFLIIRKEDILATIEN